MKIAGVSIWIYLLGVVVLAGAILAAAQILKEDSGQTPKSPVASSSADEKTKLDVLVDDALLNIMLRTYSADSVCRAEADLEFQTLPGKAQLAAVKLTEAKKDLEEHMTKLNESLDKISKFKNDRHAPKIHAKLKEFIRYTDTVLHEYYLAEKYKGILHPHTKELFNESLRVRGRDIGLDSILRGDYEADIIRLVREEREAKIQEYRSRQ